MGGWTRAYDRNFEEPLLAWSAKWEEALAAADRARYDRLKPQHAAFDAFLAALEAVNDAPDPRPLLEAPPAALARRFPDLRRLRKGRWTAWYACDEKARRLTGLLTAEGRVSEADLVARLDEARRRSHPADGGAEA